jgi:hypothetical protein
MPVKETRENTRPGDGTRPPPPQRRADYKDAILKAAETAGGREPDGLVNKV